MGYPTWSSDAIDAIDVMDLVWQWEDEITRAGLDLNMHNMLFSCRRPTPSTTAMAPLQRASGCAAETTTNGRDCAAAAYDGAAGSRGDSIPRRGMESLHV